MIVFHFIVDGGWFDSAARLYGIPAVGFTAVSAVPASTAALEPTSVHDKVEHNHHSDRFFKRPDNGKVPFERQLES